MNELLDKNKSAYKLKGIGPIYCINLDEQPERWEFMSNQFKYWEIEDKVTRISSYDGRVDDFCDILTESRPYDLALALLEEGYKVYCIDETCKDIVDERIKFVAAPIEPVCWIDL